MANKIQQAAEKRKQKHVPAEGSDLWIEKPSLDDLKKIDNLNGYVSLMYMGMKDLLRWLKELEEYVTGGERIATMQDMHMEIQTLKQQVKDLRIRLDDALKEVPDSGSEATTTNTTGS